MEQWLIKYNALVLAKMYCRDHKINFTKMFKLDIKALSTSTYMSDKNKLYEAIRDWQKEHTVAPKDNSNSAWSKRVAKYSGTHHAARTHQFD